MQGRVKFVNSPQGFGCVTPSDGLKDVHVRSRDIQRYCGQENGVRGLEIEFEVSEIPQEPHAKNVRAVE